MSKKRKVLSKETVGELMTLDFITLHESFTVKQALDHVKKHAKEMKNIHYLYVSQHDHTLTGTLSLRELLGADENLMIKQIMTHDIHRLLIDLDQEEAAKVFRDTDLVSIPVVDIKGKLIGVVHVEDILDVMQEEATEDFQKMAPVSLLEDGLKKRKYVYPISKTDWMACCTCLYECIFRCRDCSFRRRHRIQYCPRVLFTTTC